MIRIFKGNMYIGLGRCIDLEYYNIVRHFIFIVCKVRQFWSYHLSFFRLYTGYKKETKGALQKNKDRARFEGSAKFTRIIYFFVSACTLKTYLKKKSTKKPLTKTGSNLQMSGSGSALQLYEYHNFIKILRSS